MTKLLTLADLLPDLAGPLYRVPDDVEVPENVPFAVLTPWGGCGPSLMTYGAGEASTDRRETRQDVARFTLKPILPPLPTRLGAVIRDGEGSLRSLSCHGTGEALWGLVNFLAYTVRPWLSPDAVLERGPWEVIYPGPDGDTSE